MNGERTSGIGGRAVRGVAWLGLGNYLGFALCFAAGIALARILEPRDFGTVALAYGILGLANALVTWDLEAAIIACKEHEEEAVVSTVLLIKVVAAVAVFLVVLLLALVLGRVYEGPVARCLVVLGFFKIGATPFAVHKALLRKKFLMKRRGLLRLGSDIVWMVTALGMAVTGFGVWSLVIAPCVGAVVGSVGAVLMLPCRCRPGWDRATAGKIWQFGSRTWLSGLLQRLLGHVDDIVVGSFTSVRTLGLYSRSLKISELVGMVIAPPLADVALPVFAALQDCRTSLSKSLELMLCTVTRIAVPFFCVTGLLAPEIVGVIYGEKWLDVVPIYRVMAAYGVMLPLFEICRRFLYAEDLPGVVLKIRAVQTVIFLPGIMLTVHLWSATGAAACVGVTMFTGTVLEMVAVSRSVELKAGRILLPPALAGTAAALCFALLNPHCGALGGPARIGLLGTAILVAYCVVLYLVEGRWLTRHAGDFTEAWRNTDRAPDSKK